MSTYSPEYISQVMSFVSGDVVTADEFNTILNKVIHQGDHNSEWLNWLDTVGIPAAVAEVTVGNIQEYIEDEVDEQIQTLTVNSSSRTTGFTNTKDIVVINTSNTAVGTALFPNINNKWVSNSTAPVNPVSYGYAGADIVNMTSANRASDCAGVRSAIQSANLTMFPVVYQSRSETVGINKDYLVDNLAGYLYKSASFKTYKDVYTNSKTGYEMQFPVVEYTDVASLQSALSSITIDTCPIVAAPIGDLSTANITALNTAIVTTAGFNVITLQDFLTKWLTNLYNGGVVYATTLSKGRQKVYSNVQTSKIRFGVDKPDGTAALFDYTDILKLSQDKLTFTNNNGSLVVKDAANNTVITYTPTPAVVDNTLVGNTPSTSELPIVVASSGTSSSASHTNTTITAGNGTLKVNSKIVPWVHSYNSATGVLILGGV